MSPIDRRQGFVLFAVAAILFLFGPAGCIQPDHWPGMDPRASRITLNDLPPSLSQNSGKGAELDPGKVEPRVQPVGDNLTLSLDQAIVMALSTNPGLRVRQNNPVLASLEEQVQRGVFDPELFLDLTFGTSKAKETDSGTGVWSMTRERTGSAVMGLSQKLPYGTLVEAGLGHNTDDTYDGPEEKEFRAGMTITQSLLRGFGSNVNLASVRQAELDTAASVHELRGFVEAFLADTESAYWDHVLAMQEIDIFEKSLEVARAQLSEVEQRIEVGTLPPIEAAAARAEVALREQALIDARSTVEESRLKLLYFVHPGGENQFDITVNPTTPAVFNKEADEAVADRVRLADRLRPDLQEALLRIENNDLETVKTRNGLLPRLDLFITLGKTGYADSFSASFRALTDTTHDLAAGIRFSQTLGNRTADALERSSRVSREQALQSVDNLRQIIHRDVRIALNDVDRAWQQIVATRVTRMHQEEALKAEQERFGVGSSTGLLVAQAQRDLLASHIREKEAVINFRKAQLKLYLAEGSFLERRGVDIAASGQGPLQ
ncbi:MAG: TolC family protein [Pseudomonadota bacterium]